MMGLDTRIDVPLKGTSTSCNQIGIPSGSPPGTLGPSQEARPLLLERVDWSGLIGWERSSMIPMPKVVGPGPLAEYAGIRV